MLDVIVDVMTWFLLISGVILWLVVGVGVWLLNMDRG